MTARAPFSRYQPRKLRLGFPGACDPVINRCKRRVGPFGGAKTRDAFERCLFEDCVARAYTATVGLRDGAHAQGWAVFSVRGDGRELFRSLVLRVGMSHSMEVDVSGIKELELLAEGGEGHNHNSWAIWADPLLKR